MFGSISGLVGDALKIASAPVQVAADVTRAVTKPLADVAQQVAKDVKDELQDKHSPL